MKFTKADLSHSKNLLKVIGRGKWELEGMEILAFADMMRWFNIFQNKMELEIVQDEAVEKAKAEEARHRRVRKPATKRRGFLLDPLNKF